MKLIMTTEQQQSDRDFERQAVYNQYVGYSKAAARMLWVVSLLTAYLGLAMYDRSQRLTELEEERLRHIESEISEIYVPSGWNYCPAPVDIRTSPPVEQLGFTRSFRLPGFDIKVDGFTFMVLGPVLYLFAVLLYWTYLKYSLVTYSRLESTSCGHLERKLPEHVWVYNLPFRLLAVRFVWKEALELSPIIFMWFLAAEYYSLSTYHWSIWVITIPSLILPLLIHWWAFSRGEVVGVSNALRGISRLYVISIIAFCVVIALTHSWWSGSWIERFLEPSLSMARTQLEYVPWHPVMLSILVLAYLPLWLARFRVFRRTEARPPSNSLLPSKR